MTGVAVPAPRPVRRRQWTRWLLAVAVAAGAVAGIALMPVTTLQGVNYVVSRQPLPLYAKALAFLDRDVNYRLLARTVVPAKAGDETTMREVLAWTRANIRDTPDDLPVVDDHIWHIVVRGYGQDDQKADVFTTVLTYAGVPAYWMFIGPGPELPLSFVRVGDAWHAVDVANNVVFTTPDGRLARVEEIAADVTWAVRQGPPAYGGVAYADFFTRFRAPTPPELTRAEMQMPLPRLWFEITRRLGRDVRGWQMRAEDR